MHSMKEVPLTLSYRLHRSVEAMKFLYRKRTKGFDVPDEPHFDTEATKMFVDLLKNADRYLEFGSGGSTVVAAKLLSRLRMTDFSRDL